MASPWPSQHPNNATEGEGQVLSPRHATGRLGWAVLGWRCTLVMQRAPPGGALAATHPQNSTVLTTVLGSSKVAMRICWGGGMAMRFPMSGGDRGPPSYPPGPHIAC